MFKVRLISGIILVALAVVLMVVGGPVLLVALLILSLIGQMELYRVVNVHKTLPAFFGYAAAVLFYAALFFLGSKPEFSLVVTGIVVALFLCIAAVYVFTFPKYRTDQILILFFGFFYLAFLFSFLYRIRIRPSGELLVWLVFLTSWGADTCAYCVGKLFGKHKMAGVLSPKKTWEGAIGGIVGAMALTAIFCAVFAGDLRIDYRGILLVTGFAALAAVISMVGDLFASAIKRQYEIKDYGKLIPGHGGVLDRFDSLLFTAPVIFGAVTFLGVMGLS